MNTDLDDLNLPARAQNALHRIGFKTVEEVLECTWADLLSYRGFGQRSLYDVMKALSENGLKLKPHPTTQVTWGELRQQLMSKTPTPSTDTQPYQYQRQWSCPICGSFHWEHTCTIPQAWERIKHLHQNRV